MADDEEEYPFANVKWFKPHKCRLCNEIPMNVHKIRGLQFWDDIREDDIMHLAMHLAMHIMEQRGEEEFSKRKSKVAELTKDMSWLGGTEWKKGTRVRLTHPDYGYDGDKKDAAKYLNTNQIYTIESIRVGSWHTTIHLEEVPNMSFNSIQFSEVQDGE